MTTAHARAHATGRRTLMPPGRMRPVVPMRASPCPGRRVDEDGSAATTVSAINADLAHDPMPAPTDDHVHAVTAYLSRYEGLSREHTHSDLRVVLTVVHRSEIRFLTVRRPSWSGTCVAAGGPRVQAIDRLAPHLRWWPVSTAPWVIDGVLDRSPADYPRRPTVPTASPTLGSTHPRFQASVRRPAVPGAARLGARRHAGPSRLADLRGHHFRRRRPR